MSVVSPNQTGAVAASPPQDTVAAPTLLFFDTFAHERYDEEEINLDLVQFPTPVVVREVGLKQYCCLA